jgi:hypothetical protein
LARPRGSGLLHYRGLYRSRIVPYYFGKESGQASCLPLGPGYLFATGPDQNFAMTKMVQTPD